MHHLGHASIYQHQKRNVSQLTTMKQAPKNQRWCPFLGRGDRRHGIPRELKRNRFWGSCTCTTRTIFTRLGHLHPVGSICWILPPRKAPKRCFRSLLVLCICARNHKVSMLKGSSPPECNMFIIHNLCPMVITILQHIRSNIPVLIST